MTTNSGTAWTARWWRVPGEPLWKQSGSVAATADLAWCHDDEWGIEVTYQDHKGEMILHLSGDHVINASELPREAVKMCEASLRERMRGISAKKLDADPILKNIASLIPEREWITGRQLRKLTGFDVDVFARRLRPLIPRFVRCSTNDGESYSLTLPGLHIFEEQLRSRAITDSIYHAVASHFENADDDVFDISELEANGIKKEETAFAKTVARIALLVGAGATLNEKKLRMPADAEMIAQAVRKRMSFTDYLVHAASEGRRSPHYSVKRPWATAPLWLEADGAPPDYIPPGFLPPMQSVSTSRRPLLPLSLVADRDGSDSDTPGVDIESQFSEHDFMKAAIDEARKSQMEPNKTPLYVGAIVVKDGKIIARGHRGQHKSGEHAEYTTLQRNLPAPGAAANATLYCTLEPCTVRNPPKCPCVEWIKRHKISRVVIGVIDPNREIRGGGVKMLRQAGIDVQLFPHGLANEIEALNSEFEREHEMLGAQSRHSSTGQMRTQVALQAALPTSALTTHTDANRTSKRPPDIEITPGGNVAGPPGFSASFILRNVSDYSCKISDVYYRLETTDAYTKYVQDKGLLSSGCLVMDHYPAVREPVRTLMSGERTRYELEMKSEVAREHLRRVNAPFADGWSPDWTAICIKLVASGPDGEQAEFQHRTTLG